MQQYFTQQLRESKTRPTASEVEASMASLCDEVVNYLRGWVMIGKRSAFGTGCVLYWIEQRWQDLDPLHAQYESFHDFAVQETGEDYATWRMKIAIYRTFILNESQDPRIAELGPEPFLDVPVGKLQKALGAIHRKEMTEDRWAALLDSNVNDRHFYHIVSSRALPSGNSESSEGALGDGLREEFVQHGGPMRTTVSMDTGNVTFWPGSSQVGIKIGWLDVVTRDELTRQAVDRIIEAAEIKRVS